MYIYNTGIFFKNYFIDHKIPSYTEHVCYTQCWQVSSKMEKKFGRNNKFFPLVESGTVEETVFQELTI